MCGDKCAHLNKVIKKNASANLKNIVFKVISVIRHVWQGYPQNRDLSKVWPIPTFEN